jgi:hypothetical protein
VTLLPHSIVEYWHICHTIISNPLEMSVWRSKTVIGYDGNTEPITLVFLPVSGGFWQVSTHTVSLVIASMLQSRTQSSEFR